MCAQSLQSCLTLGDPMDYNLTGSSRQEYHRGLPCPPPGDFLNPGIEPASPESSALQADSWPLSHLGSSLKFHQWNANKNLCLHGSSISVYVFILKFIFSSPHPPSFSKNFQNFTNFTILKIVTFWKKWLWITFNLRIQCPWHSLELSTKSMLFTKRSMFLKLCPLDHCCQDPF